MTGKMQSSEEAVPLQTRRRLKAILSHMEASGLQSGHPCPEAQSCAGSPGADIEDLAGPTRQDRRHSGHFFDDDEKHLFDPKRFEATQRPLLNAFTLPAECYNSQKWFARECERVFLPSWSLIGRLEEIPQAGNYLTLDTEWGGPVAVCRGTDGRVHGFANVCKHRGAKVLQGDSGQGRKVGFVCPYHAWTYDFDGKLKWAPGMEQAQDFKEDEVRLTPLQAEVFHGFIFICSGRAPKPLAETLGDLPEKLAPWFGPDGKAESMVTVARREYTVDCNWKFLMENTCETYHTAVVHKGSLGPMKARPMEPHVGDWDSVAVPTTRSVVPLPSDFKGETFPLPAFTDRTNFVNLFPSTQMNVTWDCLWWMRLFPLSHERTHVQMGFCFPPETVRLERFPAVLERYLERWHIAVCEDNEISLNQQRGLRSVFRTPGRFHPLEFSTHSFNNWLLSKVLDGAGTWDPGRRVFVGNGEAWSNDDTRLHEVVEASDLSEGQACARRLVVE